AHVLYCRRHWAAQARRHLVCPGAALEQGGWHPLRRRRSLRHRALVRVRTALAALHGLWVGHLWVDVHLRGFLLLPGGDLSGPLSFRLGSPLAPHPLALLVSSGDHGSACLAVYPVGQLVDEHADWLYALQWHSDEHRSDCSDVQPHGALAGDPYARCRISGHWLYHRCGICRW